MSILQDLKYAVRALRRSPGFTAMALATLALGIGANTLIFSIVNRVLVAPLPFAEPDQLVTLWERNVGNDAGRPMVNPGNFLEWRDRARSFESMAAYFDHDLSLTGTDEPERVEGRSASASIFSLLRVAPALGRGFVPADEQPGSERVVMLSNSLWQRRFGGDSSVINRFITVEGENRRVVGILPEGFHFYGRPADIWAPLVLIRDPDSLGGRWLHVIGRLRPGTDLAQAKTEIAGIAGNLRTENPLLNNGWSVDVLTLKETLVGDYQRALLIFLGAVGLLFLIACANVANLLLVRAAAREREMAIRTSLGASRSRVIAQLLTESICLAGFACVLGIGLAMWSRDLVRHLLPADLGLAGLDRLTIDVRVLAVTVLVSLATAVVFGLAPALATLRNGVNEPLRGGRGATPFRARFRDALVVTEVSLAVVLLLVAGLLLRSFVRLNQVDPGFDLRHLYHVPISLPTGQYPEAAQAAFFERLEDRLKATTGIEAAGAISFLPFTGLRSSTGFRVEHQEPPARGSEPVGDMRAVTPGYFRAMGIPIIRGRGIEASDRADGRRVSVISRSLAERIFGRQNPVGQRLAYEWYETEWTEIVGVAGDVHHAGLGNAPFMEIYLPASQFPYSFMSVVIRSDLDPGQLSRLVRSRVGTLDANQPVGLLQPVEGLVHASLARPRLNAVIVGLFGVIGLTLAALGIYGLISFAVVQRTREIGIRMALGARAADVVTMIVRRGLRLTAMGVVIGVVAAVLLSGAVARLLYGISPLDPFTFVVIPLLLAAVALAASLVPALRASRVAPGIALREE